MSTAGEPDSLPLQMPEGSRTRSDSLEESGSQQERKRPRLSSSNSDHFSPEEALADPSPSAAEPPALTVTVEPATENPLVTSPSRDSLKMATSPTALSTKVTINTRVPQSQSSSQGPSVPGKSSEVITPSQSQQPNDDEGQPVESREPDMTAQQPEPISISSSPSRSPEIQVAELEDMDRNPAETRWTPITRITGDATSQHELLQPFYVFRTFPYARNNCPAGAVNELITQIAKVFQTGNGSDSTLFLEVKQWLSRFLQISGKLSREFLQEEPDFWAEFPELVAGLLRRPIDPPQQAKPQDLEDFFVDYAHLTLRFVQYDLDQLKLTSIDAIPDNLTELFSRPYFSVLTWILTYRDIPFYDVLRQSRGYNSANMVSSVIDRLVAETPYNMIDFLSTLLEQMAKFMPKRPSWSPTFVLILNAIFHVVRSIPERRALNADSKYKTSPLIPGILQKSLHTFVKADEILQLAINKQYPWLTIDNSSDIIRTISSTFQCIASLDTELGFEALKASGIETSGIAPEDLFDVILFAWKFKTLRKYITAGRMELRVHGMEAMQSDLVHIWRSHIQYRPDPLSVPVVQYLVKFIRDSQLVEYLVGVESHPQLISRSSNVVGFLCVTSTYNDRDSDTIWKTITQSHDPRTIAEVLLVLKTILQMSQLPHLLYLCEKLMELPLDRFDSRMLEFVGELFHYIQQKSHAMARIDEPADSLPVRLCVRLLREASVTSACPPDMIAVVQQFATDQLAALPRVSDIGELEQRKLWEICVHDISDMNEYATGSLQALNAWVLSSPGLLVPRLNEICDFTRLLVTEIAHLVRPRDLPADVDAFSDVEFDARLRMLSSLIDYVPDSITEELREVLWSSLFASQSISTQSRRKAWDMLSQVTSMRRPRRNAFIESIISDYLPRLEPKDFDINKLEFVKNSVLYEIRFSGSIQPDEDDVVKIPGVDRVWRFILQAPSGTVETAAIGFVIELYLDHQIITNRPKKYVEATHLSLVDRCVNQVMSAAAKLRSFADGTSSGEDAESMVMVASEDEISVEEMHFDRSLLFLRQLLQGMKSRPRYSPPPNRPSDLPPKPFQDRGELVTITYQPFGGKHSNSSVQKISIGDLNTGDELAHYLVDVTGFTQFTCISGGQKVEMFGNNTPLRDLRVGFGLLMVKKVVDTPEKRIEGQHRSPSPIDSKLIDHFNDLYDLLNLEERLAREVFAFLDLFPAQDRVRDSIQQMETSTDDLLPADKPYRLLYCAKALRSCIEDEAFCVSPNADLLKYSIRTITATFGRPENVDNDQSLQLQISYVLVECLLLALRAPVSLEVSSSYISSPNEYLQYLVKMVRNAQDTNGLESPRVEANLLIREPFAVLVEGILCNGEIWSYMQSDPFFRPLLKSILLDDVRLDVRRAVADVFYGLSGPSGSKSTLKSPDPRSARSRNPLNKIEASLAQWWKLLVEILPDAINKPSQSQQLFEVSLAVLNCIGKNLTIADLSAYFKTWSELLVNYKHTEVIGRTSDDFIVWGFTKLLSQCHRLLPVDTSLPRSELARDILSTFLFPLLSDQKQVKVTPLIPVLKQVVREDLYDLVLTLSKTEQDFETIVDHLDDLVAKDQYFEPNIQNDRQALRSEVGYAGLRNLSNTCYLNSLFSQLFMNLEFRDFLFRTNVAESASQKLVAELCKVFSFMQNYYGKFVDPTGAVESIRTYENEQIDVSIQMDVDEFFNLLFDRLEGQILAPEAKKAFRSLYGGQLVQQIKSRECEHISERLEPFSAIQCEIKGKTCLEDSLKAYVEGEVMQGDNKYSCTACNRHVDAVKRACLKDVPDHLIFNLKRFDFDITTMTRCKVNDEFHFPDVIDMAPFTVEHLSQPDQPLSPDIFELVGVLVHSGTAESGHYYSYIRERPSKRTVKDSWVQFNDSEVNIFDPSRIHDCCFGGVDMTSPLQFPKGYNAYMLFYQRRASISKFESTYQEHDKSNPVRLPLTHDREKHLEQTNELFIRAYCAQDRSHARFVRLLLERMRWGGGNHCSADHEIETRTLRVVLDYVQQISCRFKELPEFEATMKTLTEYASHCGNCAEFTVDWYLIDSNFRDTVLRNPQLVARRAFSTLLFEALRMLKHRHKEPQIGQARAAERIRLYRSSMTRCVEMLEDQWEDMHKFARAWNDYFDLLAHIANLGLVETRIVLEFGFLEKVMEILWVDGRGDPKRLKKKYAHFVSVREKGRVFSHAGLVNFLSVLLQRIDMNLSTHPDGERQEHNKLLGLNATEYRLLCPSPVQQHRNQQRFEWLRRVIVGRYNAVAIGQIVADLSQDTHTSVLVANTLDMGLASDQVAEAVAYLEPTLVFCSQCPEQALVLRLLKDSLDGIESINSHYGKEHLDFVSQLMKLENSSLSLNEGFFSRFVLRNAGHWAPTLLLFPDNSLHCDVSGETLDLLNHYLLAVLETADLSVEDKIVLRECARDLAIGCGRYIKNNYIPTRGENVSSLEPGQATHIDAVVTHIVERYFNTDNEGDEQQVEELKEIMNLLKMRAQAVVETLSESWHDNDSVAISDSDNADLADFDTHGLVTP